MKFQKKIMLIYIIFSVVVTGTFGIYYYHLSVKQYKEKEYSNIRTVTDVKRQRFEDMLKEMDRVSTYLLSDQNVLGAIVSLAGTEKMERDTYMELYFNQASSTIRISLNRYYLLAQFHRVIVFNRNDAVIANNNYADKKMDHNITYEDIAWLDKVTGTGGNSIVIGSHQDEWGMDKSVPVLSVVIEIQGENLGYIEVQQEQKYIDEMMENEELDMDYLFFSAETKELLYTNNQKLDTTLYQQYLEGEYGDIEEVRGTDDKREILMTQELEDFDIIIMAVNHTDITARTVKEVLPLTLLLLIGALSLSIGYVYWTSRQLSKPIRQLQSFMEATQIDNMEHEMPERISNDEIETLYVVYKDVLNRLKDSMLKEKRMSIMQLQAQFDLLQAQVNPHFIYNVLNVISNRGMLVEDEVICDICSDLAGIMRYSTNTRDKYARVAEEIEYLEQYLRLLKYRYDYRLKFAVEVDGEVMDYILPKIVLQQLAENSINHGYKESVETIEIEVSGQCSETGWVIQVSDLGCGIQPEELERIRQSLKKMEQKLTCDREHVEMEIGGMGLVNTYARLYLLYNDSLKFEVSSEPGRGTRVTIRIDTKELNHV